jgi:hypothetical protein
MTPIKHLVVYFIPENKKLIINQWHVAATCVENAIDNFKKQNPDFKCKIMGVGTHPDLTIKTPYFL